MPCPQGAIRSEQLWRGRSVVFGQGIDLIEYGEQVFLAAARLWHQQADFG
jgi:hypothetical protein